MLPTHEFASYYLFNEYTLNYSKMENQRNVGKSKCRKMQANFTGDPFY